LATVMNRSPYRVSVKNRPDLSREFPYNQLSLAKAYRDNELKEYKAVVSQGESRLLVRIRQKGYKDENIVVRSYADADDAIAHFESERRRKLFIDYTTAHRVTLAELMQRYMQDKVCRKHKGAKVEAWTLKGFIADSKNELAKALEERERCLKEGRKPPMIRARRIPRHGVEWLQRPLAAITTKDIEKYVHDRIVQEIEESTVDRELDLISQVINWATSVEKVHLHESPMVGVRRPRYFNERDRRLHGDEEARLFAAAREEDRINSPQWAIEARVESARAHAALLASPSRQKRHLAAARQAARTEFRREAPHIPLFETLLKFLLTTTARRSEALALTWPNVRFESKEAFFPDTKNARSRCAGLREDLITMLNRLPRTSERVFPISVTLLQEAWGRICKRADIEDFHIHDWRHEGISQVAEIARRCGRPFSVVELATITGHRDLSSLSRYVHLCAGELAERIDELYEMAKKLNQPRKGRIRTSARGLRAPATNPPADVMGEAYNKRPI
jgi:integrase